MGEKKEPLYVKRSAELVRRTRLANGKPLNPGKPMDRGAPLKAGKPLKAKGGSRFPDQRQPAYTAWIKTLPCTVANADCWAGIHPAHVNRTRAQGVSDRGEVVPLCPLHHSEQEGRTARFNRKYGVNLTKIAKQLEAKWALRDFGGADPTREER